MWIWIFMYAKQLELYLINSIEQQQKTGSTTDDKQDNLRNYKRIRNIKSRWIGPDETG